MTDTALAKLRRNHMQAQREKIRSAKDYSQSGVALVLGVSRPTYAELERHPEKLTLAQVQTLADFFDVEQTELQKILA